MKNLGLWTKHLIHNMEYVSAAFRGLPQVILPPSLSLPLQIYSQTQDEHFSLVIVDYDSQDIDIEAELRNSTLKRYMAERNMFYWVP